MPKERLKGEGTVRKRSDGRWMAEIMINKKRKSFYSTKSAQDALRKMKLYLRNLEDCVPPPEKYFREYIENWYKLKKEPNLKIISAQTLKGIIDNHIIPRIGHYKLNELTSEIIERELLNPLKKTHSYSRVKKVYDYTNACLKYAVVERHIIYNPMLAVEKPKTSTFKFKKIEILTAEERQKFIAALDATYSTGRPKVRNAYAYCVILYSGFREGELFALRWKDYDKEKKTMLIGRNLVCAKDETGKYKMIEQSSTKTAAGERKIPLGKKCIEALEKIREMSEHTSPDDFIVCTKDGKPMRPRSFQKSLDALSKIAGIKHITPHMLRHTFASMLIQKGVDIKVVSELLGHSSVKITYDTYVHIIKEQKIEAINKLDEL